MEHFECSDLQLASWLVASGHAFPETTKSSTGRAIFTFNDEDGSVAWSAELYKLGADENCSCNVRHLWQAFDLLKKSLGPKVRR